MFFFDLQTRLLALTTLVFVRVNFKEEDAHDFHFYRKRKHLKPKKRSENLSWIKN